MPFYEEIVAKVNGGCSELGVVAVLPNPPAAADALLGQYNLDVPIVPNAQLASLGVSGTPTLILVDRGGTVVDVWIGELTPKGEQEVLAAIDPSSTCS